jgi:hypothetical protein
VLRAQIRELWNGFDELYQQFHSVDEVVGGLPRWTPEEFGDKALAWAKHFIHAGESDDDVRTMYCPASVTPFMHALVYHVAPSMKLHGPIGCRKEEPRSSVRLLPFHLS